MRPRPAAALGVALATLAILAVPASAQQPPGDPLADRLWGLVTINAAEAWARTQGEGIQVAVLDSGIDYEHPDLATNMLPGRTFLNSRFAACDLREGCGNGDWQDTDPAGHFHGTHVAGTIAAVQDNDVGVVGVAPEAKLIPVRVLDGDGTGSLVDTGWAIRWAVDQGADVINMSLGANEVSGPVSEAVRSFVEHAIDYATAHDVVVVASAGNSSFPLCAEPAWEDAILCATAIDKRGLPSVYSNAGVKPGLRSVAAPGGSLLEEGTLLTNAVCAEGILSTVPKNTAYSFMSQPCGYGDELMFQELSGTSMAAPHVSGVAALVMSLGCSASKTVNLIQETARQHQEAGQDWMYAYGHGIVDAGAATQRAATECEPETPRPAPVPHDPACLETYRQDFDVPVNTLPEGWTKQSTGNDVGLFGFLSDGTWGWDGAPPFFYSGGDYPAIATEATGLTPKDDRLVSPSFLISEHTTLDFRTSFSLEQGRDGGVLEISTDDGETWQDIGTDRFRAYGYTGNISGANASPIEGRRAWTGSSSREGPWRAAEFSQHARLVVVDLGDFDEEYIRLRWRLVQDGQSNDSKPGMYWLIDEVELSNLLKPPCLPTEG